jgi:hypothetical protein
MHRQCARNILGSAACFGSRICRRYSRDFSRHDCDRGRSEPPRYGIVKNIETFNPIRIAFHEWAVILREALAARSLREAAGTLFAGSP